MVALSGNRIAWGYVSDDGNTYRVNAMKAMTDQAKLGGAAAAAAVPPKPHGMKMRRVTVRNVAGSVSRVLPAYSNDAAILGIAETINANLNGDTAAFVSGGSVISEQRPRRSTTYQST